MRKPDHSHISDQELLDYYRKDGSTHWMGILLERYTLLLLGVCMKYMKDEELARDCVQQIYLKVLMEASRYPITYFKSWLYMVAKNHCLMQLRGRGQYAGEPVEDVPEESREMQGWEEKGEPFLQEAVNELNREQRECIILFYLKKQSYQEIADKTGYSLMQVKSYIQNGKRNLRIILERRIREAEARRS